MPPKVEYIDVLLSDIRTEDFGFSVQILNTEGESSCPCSDPPMISNSGTLQESPLSKH